MAEDDVLLNRRAWRSLTPMFWTTLSRLVIRQKLDRREVEKI